MNQTFPVTSDFTEVTQLIVSARQRAVQAVNTALIDLYWQVGQIISRKIAAAEWGDGVVPQLAAHLAGRCSIDDAMAQALIVTRQYQKRQQTWARNQFPDWSRVCPD